MNKKMKLISIIIIICISMIIYGLYYSFIDETKTEVELDLFHKMAENETICSDIRNELFLIDDDLVFWVVKGSCSDASYSYTLFQENPERILCKIFDSIAGPQEICNDEKYQELFKILTNNVDVYNFGLDNSYEVTQFF